jgi:hypothetical protein
MAFDEKLAERVRKKLGKRASMVEKKMFGGIAFLLNGNMCCGVHGNDLIVRLDPAESDRALARSHTRVFDLTGRPMKGWVLLEPKGVSTEAALGKWVALAERYVETLPPK